MHELTPGESVTAGTAEILATPAEHDGRRYPIGRKVPALGYEVRGAGTRIYFAGDTDLFDEMTELDGVDIALLPIAGWGPKRGGGAPRSRAGARGRATDAPPRRHPDPLGHDASGRPAQPPT